MVILFIITLLGVSGYSLYSNVNNAWLLAPPSYVLFVLSVIAFILGLKGFKDKRNRWVKLRSWLTVILAFFLSVILAMAVLLTLVALSFGANEHIKTISSPDNDYTIDFHRWNAERQLAHLE